MCIWKIVNYSIYFHFYCWDRISIFESQMYYTFIKYSKTDFMALGRPIHLCCNLGFDYLTQKNLVTTGKVCNFNLGHLAFFSQCRPA